MDAVRRRSREHGLVLAACLVAPIALFVLGRLLEPDPRGWGTHEQLGFQPCWPMSHWNVPCPGCGVTTAVTLTAHGRLLEALRTQPFGPILLAGSLAAASCALVVHARRRDLRDAVTRLPWRLIGGTLATTALLAWIYKLALLRGWS